MVMIRMLQSRKGTEDGFIIKQYEENYCYEVRENTARGFFAAGWAEKLDVIENKAKVER